MRIRIEMLHTVLVLVGWFRTVENNDDSGGKFDYF